MKHKLIKKKRLEKRGFEATQNHAGETVYKFDVFNVQLTEDEENPRIWIDEKLEGGNIPFPGAYTMKDLDDLMFMYYGENEFASLFPNRKIKIIETVYPKEVVRKMLEEAFNEGFISADKKLSGEDYQITFADWYKKKYGNN